MKITVLGSGTSSGVPVPGCKCIVCQSDNPKNKRLRCSLYVELEKGSFLIDTSTDLRQQALLHGLTKVEAVLYTHAHADHTHGIDDMRCFNFIQKTRIPVYAEKSTAEELKQKFPYAFSEDPNYEGGAPAKLDLNIIEPDKAISLFKEAIIPLRIKHGTRDILGFRIRDFAYMTDCSFIPEETFEKLAGVKTVILDGLRHRPHNTHFTVKDAVTQLERIKPEKAYLTHIAHEIEHEETNKELNQMTKLDVQLAWDGLVVQD